MRLTQRQEAVREEWVVRGLERCPVCRMWHVNPEEAPDGRLERWNAAPRCDACGGPIQTFQFPVGALHG